ncbi:MAG TPA: hypothetical protein VGR08_00995, partial [Thermomicrobiales bacterium]|nr:hypothetical protein [Thermomicrobiales bacterium]
VGGKEVIDRQVELLVIRQPVNDLRTWGTGALALSRGILRKPDEVVELHDDVTWLFACALVDCDWKPEIFMDGKRRGATEGEGAREADGS